MSSEYKRAVRHEGRKRRGALAEACTGCGETDVRALQNVGGVTLCAECQLAGRGRPPFEYHHLSGRGNSTAIARMPANTHAILTDMQWDWSRKTRSNPHKSPLRRAAAIRRARHDALSVQANLQLEDALLDEDLDDYLTEEKGDNWHREFEEFRKRRHK